MSERSFRPTDRSGSERSSIKDFDSRFEHYLKSNEPSLLLVALMQELARKPDDAEDLSEWLLLLGHRIQSRAHALLAEHNTLERRGARDSTPSINGVLTQKIPGADPTEPAGIKAQDWNNLFHIGHRVSGLASQSTRKEVLTAGLKNLQQIYEARQDPFMGPVSEI